MVTHICEYVFEDKDFDFDDRTMQVIWEDLKPILTVQKQAIIDEKKSVRYDRIWKNFAFTKNYFNKLKLMNLNDGGAYIRAICEQAFEGKIAKNLPPKAEKYYTLSRLTLDLSLERKKSGSKGGKAKVKNALIMAYMAPNFCASKFTSNHTSPLQGRTQLMR